VQEYDLRSAVWVDVQKAHATPETARAAYRPGVRCRIMEITERGRRPLSEERGLGGFGGGNRTPDDGDKK
jgi:hypothetical protein